MSEQIRRVTVWSGWLRLAHWCLAAATLVLLATGWLVAHSPTLAGAATDTHYLAASVLLFALALRVFLGFFGKGAERFVHMLPRATDWQGMRDSLLFYLSLGKAPRPSWFAHNPLWKPLYLLMFLALGLAAATGWLMPDMPVLGRFYLPRVHQWLASFIAIFTFAHLYSVVLQDVKGNNADISAMLSGSRFFSIQREGLLKRDAPQVSIRLDDINKS